MKVQKNKMVFVMVMVCVVLFMTLYALMTFGKEKETVLDPDRIPLPDLEDSQAEFDTKLEAVEAIEEERKTTAPPIYPDHMVDDKGYFNPDYMEYEKQRIIDSVYQSRTIQLVDAPRTMTDEVTVSEVGTTATEPVSPEEFKPRMPQELVLTHQLFFASHPKGAIGMGGLAHIDGNQTVKDGHRLVLRLDTDMKIDGRHFPKGSPMYGFVKIRPNRVLVDIVKIGAAQVSFKAVDFQDGEEGIYVENQMRGELVESGMDATIGDINIPGIPQVNGIKRIFQRNNRSIKVAIQHQYQIKLIPLP